MKMRIANTEYCTTNEALEMLGYVRKSEGTFALKALRRFCGLKRVHKGRANSTDMYRIADIQALLEQAAEFDNED